CTTSASGESFETTQARLSMRATLQSGTGTNFTPPMTTLMSALEENSHRMKFACCFCSALKATSEVGVLLNGTFISSRVFTSRAQVATTTAVDACSASTEDAEKVF